MRNKVLLSSILAIYILLPILILFNNYLYDIKFYLLTGIGLGIFLLMKTFNISNKELGITRQNLWKSIKRNLILIALCVILILVLKFLHVDKYNPNETLYFYIFYIFISCPIQEFLYRGVFGYFDINNKSSYLWIIMSSLCYSFVHIIYIIPITILFYFIII